MVFPAMAPKLKYSLAGADQLALQIRQGAPADVFASANVKYPDQLFHAGLVGQPQIFAYNVLVVLVPKSNPANITSINDLARPGVKLVIGDSTVPVGAYTRTVLHKLGLDAALSDVVSNEPDVNGVVTKVALGETDAGVAYWTGFMARKSKINCIAIPDSAQPTVAYSVAVPTSAPHPAVGQATARYLMSPAGQPWLVRYGFRPAAPTK
ncbi:MAG: molybdate ABC transporter substrate-binding protein [Thermoleophilia bacterium]